MDSASEQPRVSLFSRVLAWIFVGFLILAMVRAFAILTGHETWPLSTIESILMIVGAIVFVPVFLIIALKGRPPRWWGHVDEALDLDKALNRYVEKRRGRKQLWPPTLPVPGSSIP